jgi:macrolide-specific efflux system membrane fusion protein
MRWFFIILGALLAGFLAFNAAPVRSWLRGGQEAENLPTLRASKATLTNSTVAIGTIKSKVGAEVKVGSQLSGIVAQLKVNVGDKVSKGDVLAALDDRAWRARVGALKAQINSAAAEKEFAEAELARKVGLGDLLARTQIEDSQRNLKVKEADLERLRASLAEAEITLGYTVIKAPVSGTIASVSTNQGETIAASLSAPTFVTIIDLDRLEVQSYVDETDIGKVFIGQPVTFRVDAFAGSELAGVVSAIYPKAQLVNNVVNYIVIIDIVDRKGLLIRPEMTVHVDFILDRKEDALSIPRSALMHEGGRDFVIVQASSGWVERTVKLGMQTPQRVEIVSGLRQGETIVGDKQAWKHHLESVHD